MAQPSKERARTHGACQKIESQSNKEAFYSHFLPTRPGRSEKSRRRFPYYVETCVQVSSIPLLEKECKTMPATSSSTPELRYPHTVLQGTIWALSPLKYVTSVV